MWRFDSAPPKTPTVGESTSEPVTFPINNLQGMIAERYALA